MIGRAGLLLLSFYFLKTYFLLLLYSENRRFLPRPRPPWDPWIFFEVQSLPPALPQSIDSHYQTQEKSRDKIDAIILKMKILRKSPEIFTILLEIRYIFLCDLDAIHRENLWIRFFIQKTWFFFHPNLRPPPSIKPPLKSLFFFAPIKSRVTTYWGEVNSNTARLDEKQVFGLVILWDLCSVSQLEKKRGEINHSFCKYSRWGGKAWKTLKNIIEKITLAKLLNF